MEADIRQAFENAYEIKTSKIFQNKDGYILDCSGRQYVLSSSKEPIQKAIYTYAAQQHLWEKRFTKSDRFLLTAEGVPFTLINGIYFTAAPYMTGKECNIDRYDDLAEAAAMLAEMHAAARGFTKSRAVSLMRPGIQRAAADALLPQSILAVPAENWVRTEIGQTINTFYRRTEELKRFRRIARRNKNRFDYAYLSVADYYCGMAEDIYHALLASPYQRLAAQFAQEGCLCHCDYTGHNIVHTNRGTFLTGFENCCIELPVYDISNFLRRRMRKCGWSIPDAQYILDHYNAVRAISDDEYQVLKLLIQFPQKLWRIVNKYYNSKRAWCEKNCLEKLEEIQCEREPLADFIAGL